MRKKKRRTGLVVLLIFVVVVLILIFYVQFTERRETPGKPAETEEILPDRGKEPIAGRPTGEQRAPAVLPRPQRVPTLKVVILIDDIGQDLKPVRELLRLGIPLNFSVLPHCRHSVAAAEMIHNAGQEVLLHLPMEPLDYPRVDPGEGALLSAMSTAEIVRLLEQDLDAVPHIRGVNNHMGSAFMAEEKKMTVVLDHIKARNLYFVDSRTAANSSVEALAILMGIPFASRDIFLDNGHDYAKTLNTLKQAVRQRIPRRGGVLVMIGHPYPETIAALQEALPFLQAEGAEPISLSSLLLVKE